MTAFYGTLQGAQDYFETKLHAELWDATPLDNRRKALYEATRILDRLNYVGEKAAAYAYRQTLATPDCPTDEQQKLIDQAGLAQELSFPRGSDTVVPTIIEHACYEIAFELLDGRDPQADLEDLATISQGYSSVRRTRDRSFVQEHLNAGVPSSLAWQMIKPFLRDSRGIRFNRV